jgi:hypothetical protein
MLKKRRRGVVDSSVIEVKAMIEGKEDFFLLFSIPQHAFSRYA